jgi:hypothetical protein
VIADYTTERVPTNNLTPQPEGEKKIFQITNLKLKVIEVLIGNWEEEYLWAVVPGGFPGSGPNMNITYNYSIGDTTVISFRFNKYMKGGSYTVVNDDGRFIFRNGVGICQHSKCENLTINKIRKITNTAAIKEVIKESDIIIIGMILGISKPKDYYSPKIVTESSTLVDHVRIKVEEEMKGYIEKDTITIRMMRMGTFLPNWKIWTPKLYAGERWYFFLKKGEIGYFPFAGSNGLFKIEDNKLIKNGRVVYSLNKAQLQKKVLEEVHINEK